MNLHTLIAAVLLCGVAAIQPAIAFEVEPLETETLPEAAPTSRLDRVHSVIDQALGLIGIRYRRGGNSVETGFDCSGFVAHVFDSVAGLKLPRTTYEIARLGTDVAKGELKPGDLVFFNTMRRSFSHVGIYLGDQKFIHAPRTGRNIRVEDMSGPYWTARFNGARRIEAR